jgi:pimeloyl-ACP methyl ester carboxylesterase
MNPIPSPTRAARWALGAVAAAVLSACGGGGGGSGFDAQAACSSLVGMQVAASAIGLPTTGATVQSASFVTSDSANGEYCAVKGVVHPVDPAAPQMEFQVNLPSSWNGKALQEGGGGYDGSLVTATGAFTAQASGTPNALARGYATLGSDGGHKGSGGFDGTFALNDEALLNYGQQSVKKTHDVAVAILKQRYKQAPHRFYFIGGSQGGHEALDAAARYAADYDGVIANYPAYNITLLQQGSLNVGRAVYANNGAGFLNQAKQKLLYNAVYAACDPLDGLTDNIIGNIPACNAAFNIDTVKAQLRCAGGADTGDTCLSDAQIAAVNQIATPYDIGFDVAGQSSFPGWPVLEGAFNPAGPSNLGKALPPTRDALLYTIGAAHTKYFVTKDPNFDPLTFDPAAYKARLQQLGTITDVTNVSLAAFKARGGKMILTHGTADDFISPHNTENYYNLQVSAFGQGGVNSFIRFYKIPGFGHGFGNFALGYDGLTLLDNWVENGTDPGTPVAKDNNTGVSRTRPMCQWPTYPKYNGSGDVNSASSFTCVKP